MQNGESAQGTSVLIRTDDALQNNTYLDTSLAAYPTGPVFIPETTDSHAILREFSRSLKHEMLSFNAASCEIQKSQIMAEVKLQNWTDAAPRPYNRGPFFGHTDVAKDVASICNFLSGHPSML